MNQNAIHRRVGIWIRVSTEMQAQGDSPEHHEKRAREYATSRGWDVVEVYRLSGVSGAISLEHPEADRMLRDIERGHITALIASKFARIARDGVHFRLLHRRFKAAKADLISLDENIDTSTPAGELILGLIADLAEWERKEIASRIRASVRPRAQAGKPLGGDAPYGYRWKDRKLVINPEEAPIRKLIHELYIEHRRKRTVARLLNEMGYRTRKGRLWSDTTIEWLLLDPSAKGLHRRNYIYNHRPGVGWHFKPKEELVHVAIEPIVTSAVWEKARSILMEGKTLWARPAKLTRHLLTGFVTCECGGRMYHVRSKLRYCCRGKPRCGNQIHTVALERMLLEVMTRKLTDQAWVGDYAAAGSAHLKSDSKRLAKLGQERRKARETIQKAFDLVLQGRMPESRYQVVCEPLEARLKAIESELAGLEDEVRFLESLDLNLAAITEDTRQLATAWNNSTINQKRGKLESNQLEIRVERAGQVKIGLLYHPLQETTANEQRTVDGSADPGGGDWRSAGFITGSSLRIGPLSGSVVQPGGHPVGLRQHRNARDGDQPAHKGTHGRLLAFQVTGERHHDQRRQRNNRQDDAGFRGLQRPLITRDAERGTRQTGEHDPRPGPRSFARRSDLNRPVGQAAKLREDRSPPGKHHRHCGDRDSGEDSLIGCVESTRNAHQLESGGRRHGIGLATNHRTSSLATCGQRRKQDSRAPMAIHRGRFPTGHQRHGETREDDAGAGDFDTIDGIPQPEPFQRHRDGRGQAMHQQHRQS